MIDKDAQDLLGIRGIVADHIGDVVDELRAIDLADLVSFVRFESFPTVEDLVNSSTELFFRPETLVFSWAAGVEIRWDALPVVTLGLEFRHPDVSVFFNLTISARDAIVEVLGVAFEKPPLDTAAALRRAFADAQRVDDGDEGSLPYRSRRARKGLRWK